MATLWFILYVIVKVCESKAQRERMMLALVLIFGSVVFFTLFEQAGTSLNLFADRNVDLSITPQAFQFLGMTVGTPAQLAAAGITPTGMWIDATITAAQTQSFNAGFILIFAPIMAALGAPTKRPVAMALPADPAPVSTGARIVPRKSGVAQGKRAARAGQRELEALHPRALVDGARRAARCCGRGAPNP